MSNENPKVLSPCSWLFSEPKMILVFCCYLEIKQNQGTFIFPHCLFSVQPQRSPGSRQESLPRTCSSQTPKHPATPEMGVVHATGQDALEKGLITTGMSPMEKSGTGDLSSLDGGGSMLPQLGDSEEKLQQVGQIFVILVIFGFLTFLWLSHAAPVASAAYPPAAAPKDCLTPGERFAGTHLRTCCF